MAVGLLALGGVSVAVACCSPLPATLMAKAQEMTGGPDVDDVPSRIDLGQPRAQQVAAPAIPALPQPTPTPVPSPTPGSTTVVPPPVYVYPPDGHGGGGSGSGSRGGPGPSGR